MRDTAGQTESGDRRHMRGRGLLPSQRLGGTADAAIVSLNQHGCGEEAGRGENIPPRPVLPPLEARNVCMHGRASRNRYRRRSSCSGSTNDVDDVHVECRGAQQKLRGRDVAALGPLECPLTQARKNGVHT